MSNVIKDVEELVLELLYTAGRNLKWNQCFRKQYDSFSKS